MNFEGDEIQPITHAHINLFQRTYELLACIFLVNGEIFALPGLKHILSVCFFYLFLLK